MGIVWFEIQQKSNASYFASCVNLLIFNTFALRKIKEKKKFWKKGFFCHYFCLFQIFHFVSTSQSSAKNVTPCCNKLLVIPRPLKGYKKNALTYFFSPRFPWMQSSQNVMRQPSKELSFGLRYVMKKWTQKLKLLR